MQRGTLVACLAVTILVGCTSKSRQGKATSSVPTHEAADDTILFLGKGNSRPGGPIFLQGVDSTQFRSRYSEWFKPDGDRPDSVRFLPVGTNLRSLKVENMSSNGYAAAHFIEVTDGEFEGTRGWIADKELIRSP